MQVLMDGARRQTHQLRHVGRLGTSETSSRSSRRNTASHQIPT
jgi:hypothetical protein